MDRELVWRNMGDCLRMIRQDVNPFGPHPAIMAQELVGALGAGKHLGLALAEGLEVLNATEQIIFSKECVKALVRMVYCSHCQGLTLIKPCDGFCLNVMRGCLASVSELDQPWRRYTTLLEQLTHAMANQHSMELALLGVRMHVSEALLYAQLHGPVITPTVDKVCGLSAKERTGTKPAHSEVATSNMNLSTAAPSASQPLSEQWLGRLAHLRSSLPLKPSKNNKHDLRTLSRDFLTYVRRSRSFFADLPELLCEGRMSSVTPPAGVEMTWWKATQAEWLETVCTLRGKTQRSKSALRILVWQRLRTDWSASVRRPTRGSQIWVSSRPGMIWPVERWRRAAQTVMTRMDAKRPEKGQRGHLTRTSRVKGSLWRASRAETGCTRSPSSPRR
uniref:Glypican 5c n=1 Tax=Neogobius melanostomus TaxID=47308 RepID=A0A8C6U072_9GOBI